MFLKTRCFFFNQFVYFKTGEKIEGKENKNFLKNT